MKKKFFRLASFKNLRGQVLLEGLIALSLASVIIIAIVTAVTSSVSTSRVSNLKNSANQYAQQAVELARTQRGLAAGFYCLSKDSAQLESPVAPTTCTSPNIDNTFIRTVEVVEDGCATGVNNVIVSVSWADTTCDAGEFCQNVQLASCMDPSGGIIAANFPTPTVNPNYTPPPAAASPTPTRTPNAPIVNVTASPTSVTLGGSSNIQWSSTNSDSCVAVEGLTNPIGLTGSQNKTNLTVTTEYTVSCTNDFGSTEDTQTVTVLPPTLTFNASPTSILTLNEVTLTWSSSNTTSCTASGGWSGTKATSGTELFYPFANTTYSLYCSGPGANTSTENRAITVTQPTRFAQSINPTAMNFRTCAGTGCSSYGTHVVQYEVLEILNPTYSVADSYQWYNMKELDDGHQGWIAGYYIPTASTYLAELITSFASVPSGQSTSITDNWLLFKSANTVTLREIACPNCGSTAHMTIYDSKETIDNHADDTIVYSQTTVTGNYVEGGYTWRTLQPNISLTAGKSYILKIRNSFTPILYGTTSVNRNVINFSKYKIGASSTPWSNGSIYLRMLISPISPVAAPTPTPTPTPTPGAPTSTPTPTPTSVPQPTGVFYRVTNPANLRNAANPTATVLYSLMPIGTIGKKLGGPTANGGYNWMNLDTSLATVANGTTDVANGWAADSNLAQVTFPTTETVLDGTLPEADSCSAIGIPCKKQTLVKALFDLKLTKIACNNCKANAYRVLSTTLTGYPGTATSFPTSQVLASGSISNAPATGWVEVTLPSPLTLQKDKFYIIEFDYNTTATFRLLEHGVSSRRQYFHFYRIDTPTISSLLGAYDIRLTVEGL